MSLPNSTNPPGGQYRKPRADLYTVLLAISLIALIVASVYLYFALMEYDFKDSGGPTVVQNLPHNPTYLAISPNTLAEQTAGQWSATL